MSDVLRQLRRRQLRALPLGAGEWRGAPWKSKG